MSKNNVTPINEAAEEMTPKQKLEKQIETLQQRVAQAKYDKSEAESVVENQTAFARMKHDEINQLVGALSMAQELLKGFEDEE